MGLAAAFQKELDEMVELARRVKRNGQPALRDPILRQNLAQCYIDILALRCNGYRNVTRLMKGQVPGSEGSIGKLLWSELHQRMGELAMEIQGPYHQVIRGSQRAIDNGKWQYIFLRSKGNTIERGTTEIQLNIIGERVLGLPKDAARAMVKK